MQWERDDDGDKERLLREKWEDGEKVVKENRAKNKKKWRKV